MRMAALVLAALLIGVLYALPAVGKPRCPAESESVERSGQMRD
jgi:hypothetical protein